MKISEEKYQIKLQEAIKNAKVKFPNEINSENLQTLIFNELDNLLFFPQLEDQAIKTLQQKPLTAEQYATIAQLNNEALARSNGDNILNTNINSLTSTYNKNVTNNPLFNTSAKGLTGAINELKSVNDTQDTNIALKQNITDNVLNTKSKTIVGAINELSNQTPDLSNYYKKSETYSNTEIDTKLNNKANNNDLALKQNITDNTLNTNDKTIVGAINELTTKVDNWKIKGYSKNDRTWIYSLVSGKKYRVSYNWGNSNDTNSKIELVFTYDGKDTILQLFTESISAVTVLGISVIGTINISRLKTSNIGIIIDNARGVTTAGKILNLEELQ